MHFFKDRFYVGNGSMHNFLKSFHRTHIFNLKEQILNLKKTMRSIFLFCHSLRQGKEKRFRVCPLILHSDVLSWLVYWQIYLKNKVLKMHCVLVKSLHKSFPLWIILITRLVVWITEGLFSLKEKCLHFQTVSSKASNFPWTACRDPEGQRKRDHMSPDSNMKHNSV